MMTVLLESAGARSQRRGGWTLASVSLHAGMVAAAIALTTQAPLDRDTVYEPPIPVTPVWAPERPAESVRPGRAAAPTPDEPVLPTIPIDIPVIPTIDVDRPFGRAVAAGDIFARPATPTTFPVPAGNGPHTPATVERVAVPLPGNGSPNYPGALRTAGVEGSVVVTFVVGPDGRAEPHSITIVSATHPLFAEAVRQWLTRTRYMPAEIGGRRVRQLVQQEVAFALR
jgi:protein TonB